MTMPRIASRRGVRARRRLAERAVVALFAVHLVGCGLSKPTSQLPSSVALGPKVPLFSVECVSGAARRLCAVVLDRTEAVPSSPDAAFVAQVLPGSTSTSTTWFSAPTATAPRTFTLLSDDGSRSAASASKVLFYSRNDVAGSPTTDNRVAEGHVGYVVDMDGVYLNAIDGAHSHARFFRASEYRIVEGERELREGMVSPEDLAWQRASPKTRSVDVAIVVGPVGPVGRRTEGALAARLELAERGEGWSRWRCDSFSYAVERDLQGRYSCAAAGKPPWGILVVDGRAQWLF